MALINLTSNYTLNRPTPRATPPSQPRTDNGAVLGEILLKSRPEAPRTAVQHSGLIICSFLQVNRTKLILINLTSNYTLNRPTPRATPPSQPRTDNGAGLGEILLKSRPEAQRTAVQHSGFIICSFLQVNRTKLALINVTSNYTLNRPTPRATPPSQTRTDNGAVLGEILLKSRPQAPRTAVQHSGHIICSFLQVNRTKLALINLTSNYTLNRPTPRATPPSQLRTDNGAVLGEILLKSRPEAPRTAIQHSGLIICSFLLVNRTKLTLINLTSNYTLNRPTPRATPHSQPRTDNGVSLGEILLKSRPEAPRTAVQHSGHIVCSFLQVNRTKLALINLTSNYTLNRPTPRATPPSQPRTENGTGLGEILLKSRPEAPRTPVQHSGFIICSFLQVNRTKLKLINLTSNYTLNRPTPLATPPSQPRTDNGAGFG